MFARTLRVSLCFAAALALAGLPALYSLPATAQDRAAGMIKKLDRDGDGRISASEWPKGKKAFKHKDADGDGYLTAEELGGGKGGGGTAAGNAGPPAPQSAPAAAAHKPPAGFPALYLVDAHSQMPGGLDPDTILPLMDQAGVWHTILSARNDRSPSDVAAFAEAHPQRITAAVRSKGRAFNEGTPQYAKLLNGQLSTPAFKAMAEVLLFHAQKGNKAPRIRVAATAPQAQATLDAAVERGWPFIAHYEFAAAGFDKGRMLDEFAALARAHPNHPFVLIHMGQLDADDAGRLIAEHPNVHFILSHSNPVTIGENRGQPWTNLFDGGGLKPAWRALIEANPDRFILGFDNVWPEHWGSFYLHQAELWHRTLATLPPAVARAVAHGNAERLWHLPPKPE